MMETLILLSNFALAVSFFGFFIVILSFKRRSESQKAIFGELYLHLLFVSLSLISIFSFVDFIGSVYKNKLSIFIGYYIPFSYIFLPFIYLFIRSYNRHSNKLRRYDLFHILPFAILFVLCFFFLYRENAYYRLYNDFNAIRENPFFYYAILFVINTTYIGYYLVIRNEYRLLENKRMAGLPKTIRLVYLIVKVAVLFNVMLVVFFAFNLFDSIIYVKFAIQMVIFIEYSLLLFLFLMKPNKVHKIAIDSSFDLNSIGNVGSDRHRGSIERIERYMEERKPFLDGAFRLADMADELNQTEEQFSFILNSVMGTSFSDFVNKYRVDFFLNLCRSGELSKFTIVSLAIKSGFNSKGTFFRAFKKIYGVTPSDYLESHQNTES